MLSVLQKLKEQGILSQGDYYFAKLIADKQCHMDYAEPIKNLAILLAALCSWRYTQGNTCSQLDRYLENNLFGLAYRTTEEDYLAEIHEKIGYLPVEDWQNALCGHIAFTQDPVNQIAPMAFQFGALYFYRAWQDEYRIAQYIKNTLKNNRTLAFSYDEIRQKLDKYFPEKQEKTDWQKVAVATAIKSPFSIITGGPGTGKTTTVTRLLLVLQELFDCKLHIKLVAPTGKAASRLEESIKNALGFMQEKMNLSDSLFNAIPQKASTLHSLLGVNAFNDYTCYNSHNPLQLDVLVVDETSMIDLPMMAKLINALKPETRLILLGDQAQLASVEAGAVLGELAQFVTQPYSHEQATYLQATTGYKVEGSDCSNPIRDCLCHLTESRRFDKDSGIGKLAEFIQKGKADDGLELFEHYPQELHFNALNDESDAVNQVVKSAVENYRTFLKMLDDLRKQKIDPNAKNELGISYAEAIQAQFNSVRFLTALRNNNLGVENLNKEIALALREEKLLWFRNEQDWYIGKPIMITENDHNVRLYNGDIGLCLANGKVWFGNREVLTSRIPAHEPAFMMTIHKSQGSEFKHTVMVLPTEVNPVLSRELVFTGVTRAKKELTVFADEKIWKTAIRQTVKRQSGLGKLLEDLN
ncbi:exodeoxyribonuclease V subunit alpha [Haemophilus influenzae]|uniref:exodeoxyribonuclease V subunit alpha n=1 Tax=Haemophilus influenzae TaxID=727 RepID=UPI000D78AED4|nr:exodeoxyribonuclease V subunit alpha [Haemophilus influenzae]MCK8956333.1 exodeoxyribonuclease V subunit alpha [Haemophilus influenzae]MCK9009809.1 exodeoxyribonuclease V subunit alpha [Haemophilus influenzae]MCK9011582.1 exodeoxyribonuclease V subunit alpha [Haemophilus influenzae]GBK95850.1 RecBCD enzyme subunit RecD [Haemophilus influenzae]